MMPEIIIKLGDNVVHKYFIDKNYVTIGRSPENEISIENLAVSREHAAISKTGGQYFVEDLNSANGTFVNGVRISKTEILDKDIVSIGKHRLHFYHQRKAAAPAPDLAQKTMLVDTSSRVVPHLRVIDGKQEDRIFPLAKVEMRIGRAQDNDIRLNDWFVSKHHALIVRKGMIYEIRDLASWRHTLVNGKIVTEETLQPGDEIKFGPKSTVIFELEQASGHREGGRVPVELGAPRPEPVSQSSNVDPSGLDSPENHDAPGESSEATPDEEAEPTPTRIDEAMSSLSDVFDETENPAISDEVPSAEANGEFYAEVEPHDAASDADHEDPEPAEEAVLSEPSPEFAEASAQDEDISDSLDAEQHFDEFGDGATFELDETDSVGEKLGPLPDRLDWADSSEPAREPLGEDPAEAVVNEMAQMVGSESSANTADTQPGGDAELSASSSDEQELSAEEDKEIGMWLEALKNPSGVIRKQAQRRLKALTGRDYDIE